MARYPNVRGGRRLATFLRKARAAKHVDTDVGFFDSARYSDGTPVAAVAAWNEFGTRNIPYLSGRSFATPLPRRRNCCLTSWLRISTPAP